MKLHKYDSYKEYVKVQTKANKKKIGNVWAQPETIKLISDHILANNPQPEFGLCHGTRRGVEQALFREYLGCEVLGTEISDTATQFPDTIEWDFHNVKEEWIGACDFIYSNSLDHACKPEKALRAWLSCLKNNGVLVIEWSEAVGKRPKKANRVDPFFAKAIEVKGMIERAGGYIIETMQTENKKSNALDLIFAERKK